MKRFPLNIKIIIASLAIWLPFMLTFIWYDANESKMMVTNEIKKWSATSAQTIIVAMNTLMREDRLAARYQMLDEMTHELKGLNSVKLIIAPQASKIFQQSANATRQEWQSPLSVNINELTSDELQQQVLQSGEPAFVSTNDSMRSVTPYKMSQSSCSATLGCDSAFNDGDILGVIDMEFSIKEASIYTQNKNIPLFIILTIAGLFMIAILYTLVHFIIIRKIYMVRNALHKLANGDLKIRLPKISRDELGDVAYDFNAMAAIIEHDKINMEDIVASRTQELTTSNERLKQSRDEALSASRTKTEFLSTMSHEIRTPLNGVIGMLSLLRTLDTDPERMDYIETAYNSGHVLLTLLNDILDISKIEANKILLEQVNFDIGHTVNDIISLLSEDASRKSLDLTYKIPNEYPSPIKGDPTRLRQIITNLISNSIKFTETGSVSLTINVLKEHKYFVLFEFKVTDTGIGISKENQSKVFNKFAQSDSSITRKYGGSGLGLAIVKKLINKMGGAIHLSSEPGKGSEFTFSLPFNRPTEDSIKTIAGNAQAINIIIISDFEENSGKYKKQLTACGWSVDIAKNDEDSISRMLDAHKKQKPYHIAIIEKKHNQEMSISLARRIRNIKQLEYIKMVVVNEIGERGDGQRARLCGISGYLVKPIPLSILSKCITEVASLPAQSSSQLVTRHSIIEKEKLEDKSSIIEKNRHKKTILLVEDNPVNQKIGQAMLHKLGHEVVVVENGQLAVEAAEDGHFHLILMDCQMPVMDGYEATRMIRAQEKRTNSHTPIVAMTANAYPEDIEKCMQSGMDSHLTKPVDISTLDKTVSAYFTPANDPEPPSQSPLQ